MSCLKADDIADSCPGPAPALLRGTEHSRGRDRAAIQYHYDVGNEFYQPDGELAPLSAANLRADEAGFELRDTENLREHYALTLRHWLSRLRRRRPQAIPLAGESMFRLWEMYLAGSIYHFESARISVNQTLFARPDHGDVRLLLTRADLDGVPAGAQGAHPQNQARARERNFVRSIQY